MTLKWYGIWSTQNGGEWETDMMTDILIWGPRDVVNAQYDALARTFGDEQMFRRTRSIRRFDVDGTPVGADVEKKGE